MILTKYITKTCVIPNLEASSKADALKELTHLLFEKKKMECSGPALDQIVAREVTESTGIGRGIAVPHARVTGMKTLSCAVGRVPDGLDFMAVDRKPVHLIFLICYPPNEQTTYLNFVATVAKLLSDKDHLAGMLNAETAEDMYNVLEELSEGFTENHEQHLRKLKADPALAKVGDAHADLILLARLQLCQEMLDTARNGKAQIKKRIENIRSLVEPRILKHYDKLMRGRPPALVPVEGDTCQGCFMRLPSKFVQQVRQDPEHIHTCTNCSRFIYVV
ncbi:MAG: PTS transporter subunit EIIA [bacterium]|nr:PTS transporter subunit EIIA [bacterium]